MEGNSRTRSGLIVAASGLRPGQPIDATALLLAADRVRGQALVAEVQVRARPGTAPGRVVVVFDVVERSPHVRLGVGYEDLSGWYLIPLQLNLDNVTGRGERADVSFRLGLRLVDLTARYRRPSPLDPRRYWEARARVEGQGRLYFFGGAEVRHDVSSGGFDFTLSRPVSGAFAASAWVGVGGQNVESKAIIHAPREVAGQEEGDDVELEDLPPEIRREVGSTGRSRIGAALDVDTRAGSGLAESGWWGRTSVEATRTEDVSFGSWHADVRRYVPVVPGTQLAMRARAGVVGDDAPFTDRIYLGGLYTVRGYPTQSLAPPNGFTRTASASIELRRAWSADVRNPRVIGLLFADVGVGDADGVSSVDAAGVGFGLRLRVPWLGHVGVDVGIPLASSQVEESFHANASIGWTY